MNRKIKTLLLTFLAVFFIGIGFFNFHTEEDSFDIAYDNSEKTGDVELVSSEIVDEENNINSENTIEETSNSESEDDYFSSSRIDRDKRYSQMLETYQNMIDSDQISSDQKGIAIEEIKKIENQKNGILVSENLIKNKGFDDVVIFINDESVSVVIKSNVSLLKEQVAQIQNIISRELNVKIENINISNK